MARALAEHRFTFLLSHAPMISQVFQREQLATLGSSEWLLTNALGGFALGTANTIPERRYHAFLIAATSPPVGRVVVLHSTADYLVMPGTGDGEKRIALSTYRFADGTLAPDGIASLRFFERTGDECSWFFDTGKNRQGESIKKTLSLIRGENSCVVRYEVSDGLAGTRIEIRPFTPLRDFHHLEHESSTSPTHRSLEGALGVEVDHGGLKARIWLEPAGNAKPTGACTFRTDPQWWRHFSYQLDAARGQESTEDLFSPGIFVVPIGHESTMFSIRATLLFSPPRDAWPAPSPVAPSTFSITAEPAQNAALQSLARAADQFIVRRDIKGKPGTSIIAGYPWFSDWGRDTCISLPGLLLTTGRTHEARNTLEAFADMMEGGLIPNCFDNGSGNAEYNTADASLWYLNAACELAGALRMPLDPSGELATIARACLEIISAYEHGTAFDIRMDQGDGLIMAGNAGTQLTWMDAKRDGVVFTPRHGKPVELSALWYNGLMRVAACLPASQATRQRELREIAEWSARSFVRTFWNQTGLFDCITPIATSNGGQRWEPSAQIRPNQIFAASLTFSPLDSMHKRAVIAKVKDHLLTPFGLRTLAPSDRAYSPRYEGSLFERDRAYHNGTAWPWLLGPYAESLLRVDDFSNAAQMQAREVLAPLLAELNADPAQWSRGPGPIAQLAEVYDGDPPHRPSGCPAQAWSIAEVLRVYTMTLSAAPGFSAGNSGGGA